MKFARRLRGATTIHSRLRWFESCHGGLATESRCHRQRKVSQSSGPQIHRRNALCYRAEIERVDFSWVAHPAQRVVAERLEAAAVADHCGQLGRDEHPAAQGLTQGLDARDLVDRRADDGEVEAVDGADIAIEHLAEMEREVDGGNRLAGPPAARH